MTSTFWCTPTEKTVPISRFSDLCRAVNARGNLVTGAHLAALAIENDCEWISCVGAILSARRSETWDREHRFGRGVPNDRRR